jgi:hypothetical protein
VIEYDGDARSFALFRPLLEVSDLTLDDGPSAQMAGGIVPILRDQVDHAATS